MYLDLFCNCPWGSTLHTPVKRGVQSRLDRVHVHSFFHFSCGYGLTETSYFLIRTIALGLFWATGLSIVTPLYAPLIMNPMASQVSLNSSLIIFTLSWPCQHQLNRGLIESTCPTCVFHQQGNLQEFFFLASCPKIDVITDLKCQHSMKACSLQASSLLVKPFSKIHLSTGNFVYNSVFSIL